MKRRIRLTVTVVVILVVTIFGGIKKKSYTNIVAGDYFSTVQVAELPGEMAAGTCEELENQLPEVPVILRVTAIDEIEHFFGGSRQKVSVNEVYRGEKMNVGEELYLYSAHWRLNATEDPAVLGRGFVNIMDTGVEYLVFLTGQVEDLYGNTPVCQLYDDALIAPVFCCESRKNEIIPTNGETTYVSYEKVKNNEFFGEDEMAVEAFEQLKEKMLAKYPKK